MRLKFILVLLLLVSLETVYGQNPLFIPPALSGTNFQLDIQAGTTTFFSGFNTPTYGINASLLAPTLIMNKGDLVSLNVANNLSTETTIHWHGFHIPAKWDGGPHQVIEEGTTWNPQFTVMNDAATYWYHPHGEGKTDLHVSKGLAGMIIVKDSVEGGLTLPRTYGVDDFPLIVQTKAFDELYQIAIATELDTVLMVNGTMDAYLDAPAQVIRLRILDGSSSRSYYFGFPGNVPFYQIATDGGLLEAPVQLTRLRLSPGERAEILVDMSSMQGQTIYLKNFGSELPNGIHGADVVGNGMASLPDYDLNPLNGADFDILQINVGAPTSNPVTTIPAQLTSLSPWIETEAVESRILTFAPEQMTMQNMVEGPFGINGVQFNIDSVNVVTYKNNIEVWELNNQTLVAHPFHIHDVQFYLLDINGNPVPANEQGKKDVVLVMPLQSIRFITKFEDFTDTIPYMYHCHILHHEDDGMMGAFVVLDSTTIGISEIVAPELELFPNPANDFIEANWKESLQGPSSVEIFDIVGNKMNVPIRFNQQSISMDISLLIDGIYFLLIFNNENYITKKIIIQHN